MPFADTFFLVKSDGKYLTIGCALLFQKKRPKINVAHSVRSSLGGKGFSLTAPINPSLPNRQGHVVRDAEKGTVYLLSQDTVDCGKVNSFELSLEEVSIESYLHSRDDDVVLLISFLDDGGRVAGLELLGIKLGQFLVARLLLLESRIIESIG